MNLRESEDGIRWIGEPVKEGMVQSAVVGPDENGVYNTVYMGIAQWDAPNILVSYNVDTKTVKQYSIPDVPSQYINGAWGMFCASDGCIYIGTYFGGRILKFDPKTQVYEDLGEAFPGASNRESYVYSFAEDDNGNIYGTTYPNAGMVKINLKSNEKTFLGSFASPLFKYGRSAVYYKGKIYCTLGTAETKVASFDPATGQKSLYDVPDVAASADIVLIKRNDKLFCLDILTKNLWLLKDGCFVTADIPEELLVKDKIYEKVQKDISDVLAKSICLFHESTYRWYQPFPEEPKKLTGNRTLLCVTDREIFLLGEDGSVEKHEFQYNSAGAILFMVDKGPFGKIYGSSMLPLRMFCYDPETDIIENLGNPSNVNAQIYSFTCKDSLMTIASYQKCVISVYDVTKPWRLGSDKTANPRIIGMIGHNQCRPYGASIGEDGNHYFASVADYGLQGGALTRYDPLKDQFLVWENIAGKQSLKTLAVIKGTNLIACGTSNQTGGGAPGNHEIPYVFLFDTVIEEIVHTFMPCEEHYREIAVLKFFEDKLYGLTDHGVLFVFDPKKRILEKKVKLPVKDITNNSMAVYRKNIVYGVGEDRLFRYDLLTSDFQTLEQVPKWRSGFVLTNDRIYGIAGSWLFTLKIDEKDV